MQEDFLEPEDNIQLPLQIDPSSLDDVSRQGLLSMVVGYVNRMWAAQCVGEMRLCVDNYTCGIYLTLNTSVLMPQLASVGLNPVSRSVKRRGPRPDAFSTRS